MTSIHMRSCVTGFTGDIRRPEDRKLQAAAADQRGLLHTDIHGPAYSMMMGPMPIILREPPPGTHSYGVILARDLRLGSFIFEPVNPLVCDYGLPMKEVYAVTLLDGIRWRDSLVVCVLPFSIQLLICSKSPEQCSQVVEITHAELYAKQSARPNIQKLLGEDHLQDALCLLNRTWPREAGDNRLRSKLQTLQDEITSAAIKKRTSQGDFMLSKQERDELRQKVMSSILGLQREEGEIEDAYLLHAREVGHHVANRFLSRTLSSRAPLLPPPHFRCGIIPQARRLPPPRRALSYDTFMLRGQRQPPDSSHGLRPANSLPKIRWRDKGFAPLSMADLVISSTCRGGTRWGSLAPNSKFSLFL